MAPLQWPIFYSYDTLMRDMTKIYAQLTRVRVCIFSHISNNRVITVTYILHPSR